MRENPAPAGIGPNPDRSGVLSVCPLAPSAVWGFDGSDPAAVPLCRRTARAILASAWRLEAYGALVDDALLVLTELVGNVFRHVDGPAAAVALTLSEEALSICVYDRSPALPRARPEPAEGDSGWDWTGFGLALIEATAAQYGGAVTTVPDPGGRGKSVGVDLPLKPPG
jgi:hypothetical protein